jgi:hypothetical protein
MLLQAVVVNTCDHDKTKSSVCHIKIDMVLSGELHVSGNWEKEPSRKVDI